MKSLTKYQVNIYLEIIDVEAKSETDAINAILDMIGKAGYDLGGGDGCKEVIEVMEM